MAVTPHRPTSEQQTAAVDHALALMAEGASQNAATAAAAAEIGVTSQSVRRYAERQGRPFSAATTREAKQRTARAREVQRQYGLAEQREIAVRLLQTLDLRSKTLLAEARKGADEQRADIDLQLQRVMGALKEASALEHELAMRGAAKDIEDDRRPDAGERPGNVSDLDESRRLLAQMEGRS
ncbi:MAG: hypothetical protein M0R75_13600 [Dehalococcoidia bacterium]|nr:hypothetical protein [Dehalococcoidia bacterium]